jgi:hypothetical protein
MQVWQSFMTGEAAARGREGRFEQGKEMSEELTWDASALDRAAPVFKRLNLVAELLMAPVAALKVKKPCVLTCRRSCLFSRFPKGVKPRSE